MTTTQENNESEMLEVSVQHPDSSVQTETELAETQLASEEEALASDQAETQPVSEEALSSGQHEMHGVNEEAIESEQPEENQGITEVVGSEHADFEDASKDPTDVTHAEIEPANVDSVGMEQVSSEHVGQQQTSLAAVQSEVVRSEHVNGEVEPMSVDIPEQQPSRSESAYSPSDVLEPIGSELENSQAHMELADSQSFDHEAHPAMYSDGNLDEKTALVKMENVHPEPMHTEAVNSDLEHQVSSELLHQLQVSSEFPHQQQDSAELMHIHPIEMVHPQALNSDLIHSEPLDTEYDHSLGQYVHIDESQMQLASVTAGMVESELADQDTPPTKRRKKKSIVWEHFTIENVSPGCRRASCKVCRQSFAYSTGSKVAGTSHLKRHIAKGACAVLLRQQENNQQTPFTPKSARTETGTRGTTDPPKRRYRTSSAPFLVFDQERCRQEISRMIIMHEYPLHMIEHPGFVAFVRNLQPRFDILNINTVQGDCVATYLREKQNLQTVIDKMPGSVSLAVDMWTSSQRTGYVFLQGQFVDHEWKLNKRLLNVVMEPFPDTDTALSHAVATCLSYWNAGNRLSSITFNEPVTDVGRENMRGLLCVKNPSILNGQLLVGSCLARTLSGMALDAIAAGQDAVRKIRSSVKYVKTSDVHEDKFLEMKLQLQVPSDKSLTLDSITRWNTTYDMLTAAGELKEVFSCLDTTDPEYKDAPTTEDWKQAESICVYLRLLLETASLLLAKVPYSTDIFFHEVWKIQLELTRNATSEDPFVRSIADTLLEKVLKYWRETFMVLSIAVAMDPRFKMKLVGFSFTKLFAEEAPAYIQMVDEGIHGLFSEYTAHTEGANGSTLALEENQPGGLITSNGLADFDMYIKETSSQQMKSELDQYLDESLLPRFQDFDVPSWWKTNRGKYPTLSKIARDILSVPLSSVGTDHVFETASREMDQYRSSLKPETLEALLCAKDWLQDQQHHPEASSNGHVKIEPGSNQ